MRRGGSLHFPGKVEIKNGHVGNMTRGGHLNLRKAKLVGGVGILWWSGTIKAYVGDYEKTGRGKRERSRGKQQHRELMDQGVKEGKIILTIYTKV